MDEKEKYRAKIEARIVQIGETINEIRTKKEQSLKNLPEIRVDSTIQKHKAAKDKLEELRRSDESDWQKFKAELDNLVNDIDEDLRQSLAYFG